MSVMEWWKHPAHHLYYHVKINYRRTWDHAGAQWHRRYRSVRRGDLTEDLHMLLPWADSVICSDACRCSIVIVPASRWLNFWSATWRATLEMAARADLVPFLQLVFIFVLSVLSLVDMSVAFRNIIQTIQGLMASLVAPCSWLFLLWWFLLPFSTSLSCKRRLQESYTDVEGRLGNFPMLCYKGAEMGRVKCACGLLPTLLYTSG